MVVASALRLAAAALFLGSCAVATAGSLVSGNLVAPLAPGQESRLVFRMPPGFLADQKVWIAYELMGLSSGDDDSGSVDLEQSFERVMTPVTALYVTFHADDMDSRASAGSITQRLEKIAGHREPAELQRLMGAELYAAYVAVNAGKGRVLAGHIVSYLPAPGTAEEPLAISVERAAGFQPLALRVTVGQGELAPEFQQKPHEAVAYKLGYAAGLACFGWLVLRFFRKRKQQPR